MCKTNLEMMNLQEDESVFAFYGRAFKLLEDNGFDEYRKRLGKEVLHAGSRKASIAMIGHYIKLK
ncbi:hypothetical protein G7081_03755 [Vagococcus coleopterorum]|uniref:Uncharacterized protein n=1 Tax=Vagococcus coleopterorum TaxID=2714946 RepID=A0A6G8AMU2_9ENTE|nr:hypothetical protein [Vagococcus coleopterorum]QIL46245.1 hypothetical protein G7081_03755 [Vagococcus coleopterorum]